MRQQIVVHASVFECTDAYLSYTPFFQVFLRFTAGRAKAVDMEFNVWDYTVPEIYGYILGMFATLELVDCIGVTPGELLDFIIDVDRGYIATFYHSFYHAADVTAVLYHSLQGMHASQYLSKPDMAALLLAGLCHDIGHPGLNNLFQINARTELYQKEGEASVLERYSCSLAMDLVTKHSLFRNISQSRSAILPEGNPATEAGMRDAMVKAILATDMAFHYDMLNNLSSLVEATTSPDSSSASEGETESDSDLDGQDTEVVGIPSTVVVLETRATEAAEMDRGTVSGQPRSKSVSMASPLSTSREPRAFTTGKDAAPKYRRRPSIESDTSGSPTDSDPVSSPRSMEMGAFSAADLTPEQRQNLCSCLLHAADISNAVKPWTVCKRWSDLVVQEFFRQGDIEKAQDLPVSPNMNRDENNQPQISLGFGDFVVQPYFEALADLLPAAAPVLEILASNRVHWLALQNSSQQFQHDPYFAVDPLDSPVVTGQPGSPGLSPVPSGRRVSVAAGVLVLDDTRSLRNPHRRLRHSTNTEAGGLRRMKRSLSGRSLSTSMQNLRAHSQRSSQSSGRTTQGQEILISALKRQASLTERDSMTSPYMAQYSQVGNFLGISPALHSSASTSATVASQAPSSANRSLAIPTSDMSASKPAEQSKQRSSTISSVGGGAFRQKRLASLQVPSQVPESIRKEYGDGYTVVKDQQPTSTGSVQVSEVSNPAACSSDLSQQAQSASGSMLTGNRSSTPALMMSKIKYDWALSPTLPEVPRESRFGCGPLDGAESDGVEGDAPNWSLAVSPAAMRDEDTLSPSVATAVASEDSRRTLQVVAGWRGGSASAPPIPTVAVMGDSIQQLGESAKAPKSIQSNDGAVHVSAARGSKTGP
ncbi:hypothetical protein BGZ98_008077 [Dissophora globulifera]|nr:hypothetical protein BGZ98_008077 [Dissophora globulifera]